MKTTFEYSNKISFIIVLALFLMGCMPMADQIRVVQYGVPPIANGQVLELFAGTVKMIMQDVVKMAPPVEVYHNASSGLWVFARNTGGGYGWITATEAYGTQIARSSPETIRQMVIGNFTTAESFGYFAKFLKMSGYQRVTDPAQLPAWVTAMTQTLTTAYQMGNALVNVIVVPAGYIEDYQFQFYSKYCPACGLKQ